MDENAWQYKGLTINNFMEAWQENPDKLEQIMIEAFDRVGIGVPVGEKLAGDLVIIRSRNGGRFPGIYVGNSHVMASYADLGVRVYQIDNEGIVVIKVRRL